MPRIFQATCTPTKTVKIGDLTVEATVLSEGTKSSSGLVLLDDEQATYVTSSASDLKATITSLETILGQVIAILTTLDGLTTSPGTAAAAITALTNAKVNFGATKDTLV